MSTRLYAVVIDARDPLALARFWARALGYDITLEEPDEVVIEPPGGDGLPLTFVPVPEPKTTKNRIHLDLNPSADPPGGTPVDIGQGDVPWTVLADPEGNEFCVLEPRDRYEGLGLAAVVVAARDPLALARFWVEAAGWELVTDEPGLAALRKGGRHGRGPWLEFVASDDPKTVKNRVHLDVAPYPDDDQAAEVARLRVLGAIGVDIGQGDVRWVVLADPEGNEFCVLTPR